MLYLSAGICIVVELRLLWGQLRGSCIAEQSTELKHLEGYDSAAVCHAVGWRGTLGHRLVENRRLVAAWIYGTPVPSCPSRGPQLCLLCEQLKAGRHACLIYATTHVSTLPPRCAAPRRTALALLTHALCCNRQPTDINVRTLAVRLQGQFDPAARWAFQAVAVCSVAGQLCFRLACAFNLFNCSPLFGCTGLAALVAGCGPLLLALAPLLWGQWVSLSILAGVSSGMTRRRRLMQTRRG